MQRIGKNVPAATNMNETLELWMEKVFYTRSMQIGCKEYNWGHMLYIAWISQRPEFISWGYKYGDLVLQVGGVSNLKQQNYINPARLDLRMTALARANSNYNR
jgi:hypothetical protein